MLRGQKKRKKLQEKLSKKLAASAPSLRIRPSKKHTSRTPGHRRTLQKVTSPLISESDDTLAVPIPQNGVGTSQTSRVHWRGSTASQSESDSSPSESPVESLHLGERNTVKTEVTTRASALRTIPCYVQINNSCWLDVSLQVLYISASIDFHSFEERIHGMISSNSLLHKLYQCFSLRRIVQSEPDGQNNNPRYLSLQRDIFREHLFKHSKPIIKSMRSQENVFVSNMQLSIIFCNFVQFYFRSAGLVRRPSAHCHARPQ